MKKKKKLLCKILSIEYKYESPNYSYAVYDGDKIVSTGISSSEGFVINDAGGYHTKEKFDKLYPNGWRVFFSFNQNIVKESK